MPSTLHLWLQLTAVVTVTVATAASAAPAPATSTWAWGSVHPAGASHRPQHQCAYRELQDLTVVHMAALRRAVAGGGGANARFPDVEAVAATVRETQRLFVLYYVPWCELSAEVLALFEATATMFPDEAFVTVDVSKPQAASVSSSSSFSSSSSMWEPPTHTVPSISLVSVTAQGPFALSFLTPGDDGDAGLGDANAVSMLATRSLLVHDRVTASGLMAQAFHSVIKFVLAARGVVDSDRQSYTPAVMPRRPLAPPEQKPTTLMVVSSAYSVGLLCVLLWRAAVCAGGYLWRRPPCNPHPPRQP